MIQSARSLFLREWLLVRRSKGQWAESFIFLLVVSSIVPMTESQALRSLPTLSASLIWFAVVLSTLLTLDKTLRQDFQEGVFEQWLLATKPFWWLMWVKSWAHWVFWILPMVLISPLIMLMLQMPTPLIQTLFLSLLLGTPVLSFVGLLSASLTLTLRSSGVLMVIIMLPLVLPVLLLGVSPMVGGGAGQTASAQMALLLAMSLTASLLFPFASAFGIKASIN